MILEAANDILDFPEHGVPLTRAKDVRRRIAPFGRSACVTGDFIAPGGGEVVILRIFHGRESR